MGSAFLCAALGIMPTISPLGWECCARTIARSSAPRAPPPRPPTDRKSVVWGKSVSLRVDLGGRRNIKNKRRIRETDSHCNRIEASIKDVQHTGQQKQRISIK